MPFLPTVQEMAEFVRAYPGLLTIPQRYAFWMAYNGVSSKEVAARIGITDGAVRFRSTVARRKIRIAMRRFAEDPSTWRQFCSVGT